MFSVAFLVTFLCSSILAPARNTNAETVTESSSASGYTLSLSATPVVNLNVGVLEVPVMTVGVGTVSTSTTAPNGYKLYLSMAGTSNDLRRTGSDVDTISATTGTMADSSALGIGEWGYAIPSTTPNISATDFDTSYSVMESAYPSSKGFAAPPISTATAELIASTSAPNPTANEFNVYYAVSPNSGPTLGGETITVATTLYATNNVDADIYMLTNTQYTDVSTTPANISNYSSAKMTCSKTTATAVTYTCTAPANTAGSNYHVYVDIPRYDRQYSASFSYVTPSFTVTVTGTNTSVGASSLSIPYGGSKTVTVTPNSGYYLSAVSCPSGYTCSGYSTGASQTGQQTVTVTNNNTTSGGTLTFTGTLIPAFYRISNMQEMTSDICASVTKPSSSSVTTIASTYSAYNGHAGSVVPQTTLKDTRDNNTYIIRKLADGQCWTVQNLRLVGPRTLTSSDSDVTSNFTITASNSSYWCRIDSSACDDQSLVYNPNNTTYGVYYNYYAATAGTGKYTTTGYASSSICPKGWTMPWGGDHENLLNYYNSGSLMLNSNRFSAALAGYRLGDTFGAVGTEGQYWSKTIRSNSYTYMLVVSSSGINAWASESKFAGLSVRCKAY